MCSRSVFSFHLWKICFSTSVAPCFEKVWLMVCPLSNDFQHRQMSSPVGNRNFIKILSEQMALQQCEETWNPVNIL